MSRPDFEGLFAFIDRRRVARLALARGERPDTGCVILDSYDLGYRVPSSPRIDHTLKALHAMGFRKPAAFDRGIYAFQTIDQLAYRYRSSEGKDMEARDMERLVISYRHYLELKAGVKIRWKLLPKSLKQPLKSAAGATGRT